MSRLSLRRRIATSTITTQRGLMASMFQLPTCDIRMLGTSKKYIECICTFGSSESVEYLAISCVGSHMSCCDGRHVWEPRHLFLGFQNFQRLASSHGMNVRLISWSSHYPKQSRPGHLLPSPPQPAKSTTQSSPGLRVSAARSRGRHVL